MGEAVGTLTIYDPPPEWRVRLRRWLAKITLSRGYGRCYHCRLPWWASPEHPVEIDRGGSLFVVCRWCWPRLSVDRRVAYAARWAIQRPIEPARWKAIERAYRGAGA